MDGFNDIVFRYLSKTKTIPTQATLVGDNGGWESSPFMDDHIGSAIIFEAIFNCFHQYYFPCAGFELVYLTLHKTFIFIDQRDFVSFTGDRNELRPLMKHGDQIQDWRIPT